MRRVLRFSSLRFKKGAVLKKKKKLKAVRAYCVLKKAKHPIRSFLVANYKSWLSLAGGEVQKFVFRVSVQFLFITFLFFIPIPQIHFFLHHLNLISTS